MSASAATCRDQEIIEILILRVRVLSVEQVARQWWNSTSAGIAAARRRLGGLEQQGLLQLAALSARPELPLTEPLATWRAGSHVPDFGAVAHRLRQRWRQAGAARRTECIWSAGGVSRRPRVSEVTHDLQLAAVYLAMHRQCPQRARTWTFETEFVEGRSKVPDAVVRDGPLVTAVEMGGQYDREKLEQFHAYCLGRGMAYEIW